VGLAPDLRHFLPAKNQNPNSAFGQRLAPSVANVKDLHCFAFDGEDNPIRRAVCGRRGVAALRKEIFRSQEQVGNDPEIS